MGPKANTMRIGASQSAQIKLTKGLTTALRLMHLDSVALSQHLYAQAKHIPALMLQRVPPAAGDWLPRWDSVIPVEKDQSANGSSALDPTMAAYIRDELPKHTGCPVELKIALALTLGLLPSGWLGVSTQSVADDCKVPEERVLAILTRLQRMEPRGIFARDLQECLILQAKAEKLYDPVMELMLNEFDFVTMGYWATLAHMTQVDEAEILRRFGQIRGFDPRPGLAFGTAACQVKEPDLTARRLGKTWEIALNRSSLPAILVDPMAKGASQARTLQRLVGVRNTALFSVAEAVFAHQRAALDHGLQALRPLTMQQVADQIGLHKSTVSRIVNGVSIDTPWGTWWLRSLFSADLGANTGATGIQVRLAQLVATEDKANPMPDEVLAEALSEDGVSVARRTVAKYRASLNIPTAQRRRVL